MRTYHRRVGARPVQIHYPENSLDLMEGESSFWDMLRRNHDIAVDTEGTGLYAFASDFRVRLVQFGTASEAWVLNAEQFPGEISRALDMIRRPLFLNATYDALVLDVSGFAEWEGIMSRQIDVGTLSRIRDPRSKFQGGTGHSLKDLAVYFLDKEAKDPQVALREEFKKAGGNSNTGWALIDVGNPGYIVYAGFDVLYTAALEPILRQAVIDRDMEHLIDFEHKVQRICAGIEYRGMRLDTEYAQSLKAELDGEYAQAMEVVKGYGIKSPNATKPLAEALLDMGEDIPERTDGGAVQVNAKVLTRLADVNIEDWSQALGTRTPNPLARAVMDAKRARKWAEAYAQGALDMVDTAGYIHPNLNSIAARTTRMSVSGWPVQQLPASDTRIRRMIIPDDGNVLVAADYSAIEFRLLAIGGNERVLIDAILNGDYLHDITGHQMFGAAWDEPGFAKRMKPVVKKTTYSKAFGGGAAIIASQTGYPVSQAKRFSTAFDTGYPGIKSFSDRLGHMIRYTDQDYIETIIGRRIYVDRDASYAAGNAWSQASGADILKQGLIKQDEAGIAGYLIAVVHDECIGDVPTRDAEEYAKLLGECMSMDVGGVPISAEGEILGTHWRKGS